MNKEYTVYSKWVAHRLRQQGFRQIRVETNPRFPTFDCWVFEDCEDLRIAISYFQNMKRGKKE